MAKIPWKDAIRFGWAPLTGIRRGHLKYTRAPKPELFDLSVDPNEQKNLLGENGTHDVDEFNLILERIGKGKRSTGLLSDEEIRRLANLGYISARPADDGEDNKRDPKDGIELYEQFQSAYQRLAEGNQDQALKMMKGLEGAFGKSAHYFFERGFIELEIEDWDGAEASYKKCLDLEPGNEKARLNLATVQLKKNDFEAVLKTLAIVLETKPNNAQARLYAGFAAKELDNMDLAIEHWREFVRLAPNHPDAARIRAVIPLN